MFSIVISTVLIVIFFFISGIIFKNQNKIILNVSQIIDL